MERCPTCGFDPATVSPSDAAVAARSFPRRFRAVLTPVDEDDEIPAEASAHAARADEAMARAARAVWPGTTADADSPALALAEAVERLPPEEWDGRRGEAAREGIHMGIHHLRAAEAAVSRR